MKNYLLLLFVFVGLTINCYSQDNKGILNNYGTVAFASLDLAEELEEISDLAITEDGRVFCIQDETAIIYQIDPISGLKLKYFTLGRHPLERDFEGLAIAGDKFYLATSRGVIFEFMEGDDRLSVEYNDYNPGMHKKFDFEGLCYDEATKTLLLASKTYAGRGYKGNRAVYSYNLASHEVDEEPRFLIDLDDLEDNHDFDGFFPSAIEKCPFSDTFVILSSKDQMGIVEISASGEILNTLKFEEDAHVQPEGITFLPDKSILISDEADGDVAKLTIYKFGE